MFGYFSSSFFFFLTFFFLALLVNLVVLFVCFCVCAFLVFVIAVFVCLVVVVILFFHLVCVCGGGVGELIWEVAFAFALTNSIVQSERSTMCVPPHTPITFIIRAASTRPHRGLNRRRRS